MLQVPSKYIKKILSSKVYDVIKETPVDEMPVLSKNLRNHILVKREDLQPIFSFKLRGAYNKMSLLSASDLQKGVVAASAGNHAQGIAFSASKLKTNATIVMPATTPEIKVKSVMTIGGRYVKIAIHGDSFDDASGYAKILAKEKKCVFIHPYDDTDVIAGQGTIGMEILRQCSGKLDAIFIPVGGGGLIAGIAVFIKYLSPETRVIAVEAEESACLQAALQAGKRVKLPKTGLFVDGVAVAKIGKEPFRVAQKCVDNTITVSNDEICAALKLMFDDTRSIAEPAGALSLAGLIKYVENNNLENNNLLTINSGANINFDRLRYVSERYSLGQKTEAMFCVTIPEKPNELLNLCSALDNHDITEFNYRYESDSHAHIFVGIKLMKGISDQKQLMKVFIKKGYKVVDMSGNELAKLHIGHMIGGRIPDEPVERIFRFEFPERTGILREFLIAMRGRWSISLFHYRYHGGIYANVLIGLRDIPNNKHDINSFLKEWKYPYIEETDNPAYNLFLKSHN